MIRVTDVFQIPALGLSPLYLPSGPLPEIRWAHVSELLDPTPWLLGNELLLTTGFAIADGEDGWSGYCLRLKNAGVAVLGISTGSSLPLQSVPTELIDAAKSCDLPLLHVPHDTLMQSVIQKVSEALHGSADQEIFRSLSVQRQLSEAASSENGMEKVVEVLRRVFDFQVLVLDNHLRTLARSGELAESRIAPIRSELKGRLREGLRWSISEEGQGESLVVLPLGTAGRLSGILTISKNALLTLHDRATLGLAASLLGILLERRQAATRHRHVLESQILDKLFSDCGYASEVIEYLRRNGVVARHAQVLCTAPTADEITTDSLRVYLLEHCDDVFITETPNELLALIVNPAENVEHLKATITDLGLAPAGLGERRPLARAAESMEQARFARRIAASRGLTFLERANTGGYRALMMMGSSEDRHQYADDILRPLDEADQGGRSELVRTAHAYVSTLGNHEATAESLGVHRHTVRSRIARITELTGCDLSSASGFLELWLAIEFRLSSRDDGANL